MNLKYWIYNTQIHNFYSATYIFSSTLDMTHSLPSEYTITFSESTDNQKQHLKKHFFDWVFSNKKKTHTKIRKMIFVRVFFSKKFLL